MPLLAYMPDAVASGDGDSDLDAWLDHLSSELPGAFFIPTSRGCPKSYRPRSDRDWVTLPSGMHLAARTRLLENTFRWFECTTAVFIGRAAEADYKTFNPNVGGMSGEKLWWDGERWALGATVSLSGEPVTSLSDYLRSRLPLIIDATLLANAGEFPDCLQQRPDAPVRIYVRGRLTAAQRDAIVSLAERCPRRVSLLIRLQKGILSARGFGEVRRLLRGDPPLDLTVVAENPAFAVSARAITQWLVGSNRRCRAVPAPRAE